MEWDVRVLCASCRAEYQEAGYEVIHIWVPSKEHCDMCRVRLGWTYRIIGAKKRDKRA